MPAVGDAAGEDFPGAHPWGEPDHHGTGPSRARSGPLTSTGGTGGAAPPGRTARPVDAELAGLAVLARDGDAAAMDRILTLIGPLVQGYCRSRLGAGRIGLSGPEDVAQEVLLAVCKGMQRFESDKSPFMAFVYGIAGNKVADTFRAAARDRSIATDEMPEGRDERSGPEDEALRQEDARRISVLLDRLPGTGREVMVLRLGLRYSAEETAELLGMTSGAVRVAQHRALNRIRQWLAEEPEET